MPQVPTQTSAASSLKRPKPQEGKTSNATNSGESAPAKKQKIISESTPSTSKSIEKLVSNVDKQQNQSNQKLSELRRILNAEGSISAGKEYFKWLINPFSIENFFDQTWERTAIVAHRKSPNYYKELISSEKIDEMLRKNTVEFTKNLDVTSYVNGVRETHNPEGRALPPQMWDFYRDGCSIRLLNPQTFIPVLHSLNANLQEYFHCMVGANAYLTPANSQGFAPHYDDIEAFVLQIEGKKRWRVYAPRTPDEVLPRNSSQNFNEAEVGEPILDTVLEPGDLLYFPRGFIHQAHTVKGAHSLHITLSVYQKNAYADLFEQLVPRVLSTAITRDVELRRGLPLDIWHNFGVVFSDVESPRRAELKKKIRVMLKKMVNEMEDEEIDDAVDQLALRYQHDALPPKLNQHELENTVLGTKTIVNEKGEAKSRTLTNKSRFRLVRANILRLVRHEEILRIYFHLSNGLEYHEAERTFLDVEEEAATVVDYLFKAYPKFTTFDQLPIEFDDCVDVVTELWNRGLIQTENVNN